MIIFFSFVVAAFVTMVMIPPIMRWAASLRAVDLPNERKIHEAPVPRLGGFAIATVSA